MAFSLARAHNEALERTRELIDNLNALTCKLDGEPARAEAHASRTAQFVRVISSGGHSALFPLHVAEIVQKKGAQFITRENKNLACLLR